MQVQVNIESPHIKISEALQSRVQAEFQHLKKYFDRITGFDVVFRKVNSDRQINCEVEARLLIPKSSFFARYQAGTFESALDRTMQNLVHQLKREKEARQELD